MLFLSVAEDNTLQRYRQSLILGIVIFSPWVKWMDSLQFHSLDWSDWPWKGIYRRQLSQFWCFRALGCCSQICWVSSKPTGVRWLKESNSIQDITGLAAGDNLSKASHRVHHHSIRCAWGGRDHKAPPLNGKLWAANIRQSVIKFLKRKNIR